MAGGGVCGGRLASEADAPFDGAFGHLLPIVEGRSGLGDSGGGAGRRRGERSALARSPPTIGRRGSSGCTARRIWPTESANVRPQRKPELPKVLADTRYGWDVDEKAADRNRRSVYVLAKRNMRLPMLAAFDQPDMQNSCPRRSCTITAPQALELLNGELTEDTARAWSGKLLSKCGNDEARLVREAYSEAYGRMPQPSEIKAAEQFVDKQAAAIAAEKKSLDEKELPTPMPERVDRAKAAAIVDFCHAIMCSNEFLYID